MTILDCQGFTDNIFTIVNSPECIMYEMVNTTDVFREWLLERLNEKGWSQSELARAANVSRSAISESISGRHQIGQELATAIARALKFPPEDVFRVAGLLPPAPEDDEWDRRLIHLLKQFPPEEKEKIIKRLELEAQFYEQRPRAKSPNKTRA